MNKKQAKILLKLADALVAKVQREQLDMRNWYIDRACGTSACAFGWGCVLVPEIKEAFRLKRYDFSEGAYPVLKKIKNSRDSWGDLEKFFGLTTSEIYSLFSFKKDKDSDPTPKQKAAQFRRFVYKIYPELRP